MADNSKIRDRAWPEVTKSVWSEERMAVRAFMKEEWKERFEGEICHSQLCKEEAAEKEADQILTWWRTQYPDNPKPETDSREFANWLLRKHHDHLRDKEKLDPFDNKGRGRYY